uniref:ACB domain-containing protein n=1 Tax=Anopheles quadriannulatus TaxID=34691 RepID=A0A182XIJ5_ANOQN
MEISPIEDLKIIPDIVQPYPDPSVGREGVIVIDNGSFNCRAGWMLKEKPALVFRNILAKPRKDRNKKDIEVATVPVTQIGNDIVNIEALRLQLRTQFDRNVVTHYNVQEQIFDYIFTKLGINSENSVPHKVMITECLFNPNYCRSLMSELLFECYDIPGLSYGVDSLLSFHSNQRGKSGLIIATGYHTTHVVPVLNGRMVVENIRRINIGGSHMIAFLHRCLQLKYTFHLNAITLSRSEVLLHKYGEFAYDYMEALQNWACLTYYDQNVKKIQLPYNQTTAAPALTTEQKFEKKKELSKRLAEINARRREERLAQDEELLMQLQQLEESAEDGEDIRDGLVEHSIKDVGELKRMIATVNSRIEKARQKMNAPCAGGSQSQLQPDSDKLLQPPPNMSVVEWVEETRRKRDAIIEKRQARRQRKQDLAKRRTAAAQERMRIISHLARKEKGSDDFGMRDEDWDVYKQISREEDSDNENESERLVEYDIILKQYDSTYEDPLLTMSGNAAELYQLHVGVERIRAPEILFQPSIIGSYEAGLAETIDFVLKLFPAEQRDALTTIKMSIEERFNAAVNVIRGLPKNGPYQPSNDMLLRFYSYYKQATKGKCCERKPAFWDVINRAKWDAWNRLGDMDKEVAMQKYVDELKKLSDDEYIDTYDDDFESETTTVFRPIEAVNHAHYYQNGLSGPVGAPLVNGGEGLGKNSDGITAPLKASFKFSTSGIGADKVSDAKNNWWERVYNEAACNIEVESGGNTKTEVPVSLRQVDAEAVEITTKSYSVNKLKRKDMDQQGPKGSMYGSVFLKASTLLGGLGREEDMPDHVRTEDIEFAPVKTLTDEELFAACGGRTAHKGARHGLKLNGKLARIDEQNNKLLQELESRSFEDVIKSSDWQVQASKNGRRKSKKQKRNEQRWIAHGSADAEDEVKDMIHHADYVVAKNKKKQKVHHKTDQELANEMSSMFAELPEEDGGVEENEPEAAPKPKSKKPKHKSKSASNKGASLEQELDLLSEKIRKLDHSSVTIKKKDKKKKSKLKLAANDDDTAMIDPAAKYRKDYRPDLKQNNRLLKSVVPHEVSVETVPKKPAPLLGSDSSDGEEEDVVQRVNEEQNRYRSKMRANVPKINIIEPTEEDSLVLGQSLKERHKNDVKRVGNRTAGGKRKKTKKNQRVLAKLADSLSKKL